MPNIKVNISDEAKKNKNIDSLIYWVIVLLINLLHNVKQNP